MYAYKVTQFDVRWCRVKAEKYYIDPHEANRAFEEWANIEPATPNDGVIEALQNGQGWVHYDTTYSYYINRIEII